MIDPVTNVVNKKKILIYPGGMKNNGITSSAINLLENLDYSRFDVTIFLNRTNNAEVLNNLNNVNENVRIILRRGPLFASLKEMYIVNFIRQRGLNKAFEKWLYPKKFTNVISVKYLVIVNLITLSILAGILCFGLILF